MRELEQIREQLDLTWDYQLKAEDALLAQRRRHRELNAVDAEARAGDQSLPPHLKG